MIDEADGEVCLKVDVRKNKDSTHLHKALCAWRLVAARLDAGEITREEYGRWSYHYPEFDNTKRWAKVPSQKFSDMIVEELNAKSEEQKMDYFNQGSKLRISIKSLVYDFMQHNDECSCCSIGMKQAEIFRACGLDWGEYPNATSTNQQYWIVALLRELEKEGKIQRDIESKRWRIIE